MSIPELVFECKNKQHSAQFQQGIREGACDHCEKSEGHIGSNPAEQDHVHVMCLLQHISKHAQFAYVHAEQVLKHLSLGLRQNAANRWHSIKNCLNTVPEISLT